MTGFARWRDIRGEFVERAGGEAAVAAGKQELLATVAEFRRAAKMRKARDRDQRG